MATSNPHYGIFDLEIDLRNVNRKRVISKNEYSCSVKGNREKKLEDMGIFSCII